ncbi:palmitoyltransferase ZDHHC4-like [Amphiura filiformis]|uniref:palmitoyltransferase ZDHHC4-like n=1 Tax=Amphiura filiformis TaxID=82378 RepID=UPI003B21AF4E
MADFLILVILYMITFTVTAYIFLMGDTDYHRNGVVGKTRAAIVQVGMWIFNHIFPPSLQDSFINTIDHVLYTRNCYLQIVYLLLLLFITVTYTVSIQPHVEENDLPPAYSIGVYATLTINWILFLATSFSDPGEITEDNQQAYNEVYAFDGLMYVDGNLCRTCGFVKPARSKHCAFCDRCVHRFDHHCSWVNNCIGGSNVHLFLMLLITIALGSVYGTFVTAMVFVTMVRSRGIMEASYVGADGRLYPVTRLIAFQHMFMEYPGMVFLMTCLSLLSILVGGFAAYHMYLAITNQTTNERYKRAITKPQSDHQRQSDSTLKWSKRTSGDFQRRSNSDRTREEKETHWRGYSKGMFRNLIEIFFPFDVNNSKKR